MWLTVWFPERWLTERWLTQWFIECFTEVDGVVGFAVSSRLEVSRLQIIVDADNQVLSVYGLRS